MGRQYVAAKSKRKTGPRQTPVETTEQLDRTRARKSWTERDCKDIVPLTDRQDDAFRSWYQRADSHLALLGSAGVGKTLLACYLGINEVLNPKTPQKQLIIVRAANATKEIGFLPGTKEEKEEIFQLPYFDVFRFLFNRAATYRDMCDAGVIKFTTTSHIRGLTFENAIVIFDEIQSASRHDIDSLATRLGDDSRLIMIGDGYQNDLHSKRGTEVSGFDYAVGMMHKIDDFDVIQFTHDDIVRSGFVKKWIIESERIPK